jgi:hypothetical protein
MTPDTELEIWRQHWHAQPSVPLELFRNVERGTTYMRHYRVAEILATVFFGGGSMAAALITRNPDVIYFAIGICVFIVLAWIFTLRSTRGLWAPSAPTTASYVDLSIRRCRWKIADAKYDIAQGLAITVFVLIIDYRIISSVRGEPPSLWLMGGLFIAIAAGIWAFLRRKILKVRAELTYLLDLRRQLENPGSEVSEDH